jgi:hypothetical protein
MSPLAMAEQLARILVQLDPDPHPSLFDRVVAVDAGADHVMAYGGVTPEQVEPLVHGAIFTRAPEQLSRTAIFVGGGSVETGEKLHDAVRAAFVGPMTVSVMMDAHGANTTAAAAVLSAAAHLDLAESRAVVLAGTGPVGQRAARLLGREGAAVRLGSRAQKRAAAAAQRVNEALEKERVAPLESSDEQQLGEALRDAQLVISAGAAGVQLLPRSVWTQAEGPRVLIDLNAVPPAGIEGVEATDKAEARERRIVYGAIGVGGRKMRIHKAAVASLFTDNQQALDAEAIADLGKRLG